MANNWRELYSTLPAHRRIVIDARVAGELARMDGKPMDSNPYLECGYEFFLQRRAWNEGWGDADEVILANNLALRDKETK